MDIKKIITSFFVCWVLVGGMLTLNSCTAVGYLIGASVEKNSGNSPRSYEWTPDGLSPLPFQGAIVKVKLKNGQSIKGKFHRIFSPHYDSTLQILVLQKEVLYEQYKLDEVEKMKVLAHKPNARLTGLTIGILGDVTIGTIIALSIFEVFVNITEALSE